MPEDFENEKIRRLQRAMYSRSLSKRLRMRARRELKPISHDVSSDWTKKDEHLPGANVAPRGIRATRSLLLWILGIAIAFFFVSAGVFVYYFTIGSGASVAAPGNIDITVRGPFSVVGGELAELQITVVNRNKAPLELADIVIKYPEGTRSPSDFLTDLPRQRISLGSIEPGGRRQGTVSAVFIGTEGARKNVRVELEYRIADSSAIFVSETDYNISFTSSPVSVSIDSNKETVSGQAVVMTATIASNVDTILKDVLVEADFPFGFTLESANPSPSYNDKALWEIGNLEPGREYKITVRGRIEGQSGDERVFRFNAGTRKKLDGNSIDVLLAEGLHHTSIARPFIGLDIALNKQSGEDPASALPGESVNVAVSWVNNLPISVNDAVIVASLNGFTIDGRTVRTTDGFYRSTDNTVLWDKSTTRGELAMLTPGQRGTVSFSFEVPPEAELLNERNSKLTITVHVAGKREAQVGVPETLQATAQREVKLESNLEFVVQGFYYQNPFGSIGPLPPKVNQETTYAIVFTVANTSNRIEDAVLTATLPPYVRWMGVHSPAGERIDFIASDGGVRWNMGDIAPGVGVGSTPPRQVAFAIGFTPSASQIGQEPPLIRDLQLTGYDSFVEKKLERDHLDVTTNLLDDPGFSTTESQVAPLE